MLIKNQNIWAKVIAQGNGFIYNDFGTQFPGNSPTWNTTDFNKLHKTACSQVKRMTYKSEGKLTKHFFENREEALDWLSTNRKKDGYTFCAFCNP